MFPEPDDYVREMQSRCDTEVKRVNALLSAERARAERAERERDEAHNRLCAEQMRSAIVAGDLDDRLRSARAWARRWKLAAKRYRSEPRLQTQCFGEPDTRAVIAAQLARSPELEARLEKWAKAERRWIDETICTESGHTTRFCKWAMVPEGEE